MENMFPWISSPFYSDNVFLIPMYLVGNGIFGQGKYVNIQIGLFLFVSLDP